MFPSTGHFKSLHCPFHLEGECGRIYCHYRHAKSADERAGENNTISALEKKICEDLSIDSEDEFKLIVDEKDEVKHEKLLSQKLKNMFPDCDKLLDNLRLPEISKDNWDLSVNDTSSDLGNVDSKETELENDGDSTLDDGPLKQILEEDSKKKTNSEQNKSNPLERRHLIFSCLEKLEKRSDFYPRRVGTIRPKKFATVENFGTELVNETSSQGVSGINNSSTSKNTINVKQEDPASENSSDEDAEVDSLLTQISMMNPQLFTNSSKKDDKDKKPNHQSDHFKTVDLKSNLFHDEADLSQDFGDLATQPFTSTQTSTSYASRNTNSGTNRDSSTVKIKKEKPDDNQSTPALPQSIVNSTPTASTVKQSSTLPQPIVESTSTASIAEQNRVKNLFKNTICSNIDQFFDFSDACRVYGTEIFNLLEPLFSYLVQKLNPQFNFEKIRQLHSQNISLVDGLPFVCSCEHLKTCMECYNIMLCAVSRANVKTCDKVTETPSHLDTPFRKIEDGLNSITKEIMSIGIPCDDRGNPIVKLEKKNACCQVNLESRRQSKSSTSREKHHDSKHHSSKHKSRSESKSSNHKKERTGEKHSSHSSRHKSSRSRHEEKKNASASSDENEISSSDDSKMHSKHRRSSDTKIRKRSSSDKTDFENKKPRVDKVDFLSEKKTIKSSHKESPREKVVVSDDSDFGTTNDASEVHSSEENYSDIEDIGNYGDDTGPPVDVDMDSDIEIVERKESKSNSESGASLFPSSSGKKRVSHVTEDKILPYNKKPFIKKNIPSPSEVLFQRMQKREAERKAAEEAAALQNSSNDRVRISHVPNVALLLKAKERLKSDLFNKAKPQPPPVVRTSAQTNIKGKSRIAHIASEVPPPKDVPAHAVALKPTINSYKANNNIPLPTRQNALDRLYGAYSKKVPPELACELALKEEQTIHEKVTIVKVYLNSLAMALHRISKENPAKLTEKTSDFPSEINGYSTYDLLSRHILTREQLEVNGFPIPIRYQPGCCKISTKAIHYKPLTSKRSGDKFFCIQCKEPFEINHETGLPITPASGCKFHTLRPRKEPGRLRHELFYPCCNKNIAESGCMVAEYHTPDTTDDDCLEDFVETRDPPPGDPGARQFYALDCEMCCTTVGSELTRVTVIKPDCEVIYDSLVKPFNPILDYCTKFSGITEEKLRNVTKTLDEVRQEMLKFIFKDTILIGHSLENDLKALKIQHRRIVDTSVMYPHRDAPERKFSLKYLSSTLVHFLIQESEFGHDSKEDAVACMKLVWKKIREDAQVHRPKKIIGSPERKT